MSTETLIQLALEALGCTQKELAARLGVSPAQISKWKKSEYMSMDMQSKLSDIAGIGDLDPDFVSLAGSRDDALKWAKLFRFLAELAEQGAETGYDTYRLQEGEEEAHLNWHTFYVLKEMGVDIPTPFPPELDFDYDGLDDSEESEHRMDELFSDPNVSLVKSIYKSYTDVYGFYAAYVGGVVDKLDLYDEPICDIEPCLMELAASKLEEVPAELAKNYQRFQWKVKKNYTKSLMELKDEAVQAGVPLRAELLDLVYESHDALGQMAEAEALRFNDGRLHPDIYMNELLVGMRTIHQILPAILKKLGIEDEFTLDPSELRLG